MAYQKGMFWFLLITLSSFTCTFLFSRVLNTGIGWQLLKRPLSFGSRDVAGLVGGGGVRKRSFDRNQNKVILLWNSFYKSRDFGAGSLGRRPFVEHKCAASQCSLETNRALLNVASAVVFHIRSAIGQFPKHANRNQLFVYFLMESPHHTYGVSRQFRTRFNVTMTYRRDSDIPIRRVERLENVKPRRYTLQYPLSSRKGDIFWLVSHCRTPSKREVYAKALGKYINVDVYGGCGPYKCSRGSPCMEKLQKKYKFYLSFENSYCTDYVTEKYYRTLEYEVIPIVYGRANYTEIGPSGAVIDIRDYRSPMHLAQYLRYLSRNETAYGEYFQHRQYWRPRSGHGQAFCDLCQLVHNASFRRSYRDVHNWWLDGACDLRTVDRLVASARLQ